MGNPYLEGNYAPVTDELTVTALTTSGTIPAELDGRYLRNGPNPIGVADPATYHWFSGDGMVHGVRLRDGRAEWYRNRWVRSADVAAALGEPPPVTEVDQERDFAPNTNVVAMAGRTYALVEAGPRPYELTDELETIGASDFEGTLPLAYTAHPKVDPVTGETHAVAYWWGWGEQVQHLVIGPDGRVRSAEFVETTGSPMVHDLSITERYAVVYDLPVRFDLDIAMAGRRVPYRWDDDYPARLGLVPRAGGEVRWAEVEPCYVYHPLNAFDDGDEVVLDVCRWPRMFDRERRGPGGGDGHATLWRWHADPTTGRTRERQLDDRDEEFPRIDERVTGRRHRYGYAAVGLTGNDGRARGGIVKHDLDTGGSEELDLGAGAGASEVVFVPAEGSTAEDHGWLIGIVYDAATDSSDLVVIDARDLTAGPVGRVHLPRRVPFGFHGNWIPTGGSAASGAQGLGAGANAPRRPV